MSDPAAGLTRRMVGLGAAGAPLAGDAGRGARAAAEGGGQIGPSPESFGAKGDGVTDDHGPIQAWLDHAAAHGGTYRLTPGACYLTASQVTLRVVRPVSVQIIGYGATLATTGAISALKISDEATPFLSAALYGVAVDHRGAVEAVAGFEAEGTAHLHFVDCTVVAHSCRPDYAAFWLHQIDPGDPGTGCFWTSFDHCAVRKLHGADPGIIPVGVRLQGAANGTVVRSLSVESAIDGVVITPEPGHAYVANAVMILGCWFEGLTNAVRVSAAPGPSMSGLQIASNRLENIANAVLRLEGATQAAYTPPVIGPNFREPDVRHYVDNPAGLPVQMLDPDVRGGDGPALVNAGPVTLRSLSGAAHTLELQVGGYNRGLTLADHTGPSPDVSGQHLVQPGAYEIRAGRSRDLKLTPYALNNVVVGGADGASTWRGGHLVMGGWHLWIDAHGRLRLKQGAPVADEDGRVLGG
jgi:hypothetical protein